MSLTPTPSRFPLDLTLNGSPIRVTRAGTDALVYHPLALNTAEPPVLVRSGPDIPAAPFAVTDETTDAEILAHLANPPVTLATAADIAAHRYTRENGGVAVVTSTGTHRFDTTRENRSMWLAVQLQAQANSNFTQTWKTLDGEFVQLTASDVLTVCEAVYMHVAVCFSIESSLLANPPALADLPAAFDAVL